MAMEGEDGQPIEARSRRNPLGIVYVHPPPSTVAFGNDFAAGLPTEAAEDFTSPPSPRLRRTTYSRFAA